MPLRGRFDRAADLGRALANMARGMMTTPQDVARTRARVGPPPVGSEDFQARQIVARDFRTAINVGVDGGPAGVRFNADGIEGWNASDQQTFDIATDGSGFLGRGATQIVWGVDGAVQIPGGAIDAGTIEELQLANEAVTNAKIAVDAIQGDVIAANAITNTKIADNAISTPKLQAGSVVAGTIAAGAVVAEKIEAGAVVSEKIQAGAVTSDKITVDNLAAIHADLGSITAGTVTGAVLRTAASGNRVEMNSTGFHVVGVTAQQIRFWSGGTIGSGDEWSIRGAGFGIQLIAQGATVFINANLALADSGTHLLPTGFKNNDIGSSSLIWRDAYLDGTLHTHVITHTPGFQGDGIRLHTSAGANRIGFFNRTAQLKKSANNLASLLQALDEYGLINDTS
jgi:hypothetical protein